MPEPREVIELAEQMKKKKANESDFPVNLTEKV
jgi:hypothetical protein